MFCDLYCLIWLFCFVCVDVTADVLSSDYCCCWLFVLLFVCTYCLCYWLVGYCLLLVFFPFFCLLFCLFVSALIFDKLFFVCCVGTMCCFIEFVHSLTIFSFDSNYQINQIQTIISSTIYVSTITTITLTHRMNQFHMYDTIY